LDHPGDRLRPTPKKDVGHGSQGDRLIAEDFVIEADQKPIVMLGTAVLAVQDDGLLQHNWIGRVLTEPSGERLAQAAPGRLIHARAA